MDRRTFLKAGTAAGLLAGVRPAPATAQEGSVLRLAMTLSDIPQTTGMATQGAEGIRFITNTIYDGLLRWDLSQGETTAEMVPSLAESYEIDESGTVWTFHLRQGVTFHDGAPFSADDVIWNLEKLSDREAPQFDQAQANQAGSALATVASYEKIDDFTVAITTKAPDSMFFYKVDRIGISSRAHWEALGGDWAKFAAQPSGTGPFQLVELVPRERAELVKNAGYWDPNRVPKVDRLTLYAMPDPTTRVAALLSGQVDWVEAPPPDTIPRIERSGAQIVMNVYPHVWPFWLSFHESSPFRDINVRRAANLAIDRDGIAQFLGGRGPSREGARRRIEPLVRRADLRHALRPGRGAPPHGRGGLRPGQPVPGEVPHLAGRLGADAADADVGDLQREPEPGRVRGRGRGPSKLGRAAGPRVVGGAPRGPYGSAKRGDLGDADARAHTTPLVLPGSGFRAS